MKEHNDDDVTIEDTEEVEVEEAQSAKLKSLRAKLKQCENEKMSYLEEVQRIKADFLNSKRRIDEQFQTDKDRISIKHIESLLPLCDSFEMAMSDKAAWEECDEKWRKGMEGIYTQLLSILKSHNVSEINAAGAHFDPNAHEAVSNETVDDTSKIDTVVSVLQKGYMMHDRVIRPARVTVGAQN